MQHTSPQHTPQSTITIAPDIQSIYDLIHEHRQQRSSRKNNKTIVGDELLYAIIQR
ncbi:hypothetical protein KAZ93_00370 [Patescibacteria group bacterium]|nr:hypothetical protein [Patescibacteria group bacterium]